MTKLRHQLLAISTLFSILYCQNQQQFLIWVPLFMIDNIGNPFSRTCSFVLDSYCLLYSLSKGQKVIITYWTQIDPTKKYIYSCLAIKSLNLALFICLNIKILAFIKTKDTKLDMKPSIYNSIARGHWHVGPLCTTHPAHVLLRACTKLRIFGPMELNKVKIISSLPSHSILKVFFGFRFTIFGKNVPK